MMKDNNFASKFKNKADKLNAEVRPKLWDKLEKRMDDHYAITGPARFIHRKWLRYAASLLLLILGGFFLSKIGDHSPATMSQRFVIEEVNHMEADQTYKEMVDFSQKYYNTLINPGVKAKSPL